MGFVYVPICGFSERWFLVKGFSNGWFPIFDLWICRHDSIIGMMRVFLFVFEKYFRR